MIKDSKYIIRRVIIGVLITLILSFISSCEAHAKTYQYVNDGSSVGLYPSGSNSINFNQWYEPNSNQALQTINLYLQSVEKAENDSTLYNGVYLIDFYIVTSGLNDNLADCSGFSSDYRFIDLTSGNVISSAINIKSECVNSYYTRYNNSRSIHYLVQFKIDSTGYSYDLTTRELRLINRNYNGSGFVNYGVAYNVVYGGIYDYSSDIVTSFEQYAQNAKTNQSLDELNNNIRNQISNDNSNTNSIINNNNQNTQNIINNQDTNSQNEINNANTNSQNEINAANQNTDKEIESQKSCTTKVLKYNDGIVDGYLNNDGTIHDTSVWSITDYIEINELEILSRYTSGVIFSCFYNENKTLISCISSNTETGIVNLPSNTKYARFSIRVNDLPQYKVKSCKNGNQAINDSINDLNDNINDSSIPSDSESKINSITDKIKDNQNTSIVQIATFFPQMLQLIINGMNTNCTGGYSLGSLYGTELSIPCINPVDYLGSFLWGVIDSILCLCYLIPLCKFLVNKYNDLTSLNNLRWQ